MAWAKREAHVRLPEPMLFPVLRKKRGSGEDDAPRPVFIVSYFTACSTPSPPIS